MTISLTVPRKELIEALKMLRKHAKKKGAGDSILSYEDGMLTIQISGAVARAEAHGDWPGEARVPGRRISRLGPAVPPGDPVEISVEQGRLNIGSLSFNCVWQQKGASRILLPLDAPLPVILSAALKYSQDEITHSPDVSSSGTKTDTRRLGERGCRRRGEARQAALPRRQDPGAPGRLGGRAE